MSDVIIPFKPVGRSALPYELLQFGKHLVYSEGTKTEPYYVEGIRDMIARKYQVKQNEIEIISVNKELKSYNTLSLVKYAKKDVSKRLLAGETINHVWLFYDKDDFPMDNFINAHKQILRMNNSKDLNSDGYHYNLKTEITWHSCFSNEAFELWLLLYFKDVNEPLKRGRYKPLLEACPPLKEHHFTYRKNLKNIHGLFTFFGGSMDAAIKRAEALYLKNGLNNPSTKVYEFASYFKNYLEPKL